MINSFAAWSIEKDSDIHKFKWSSENAEYCKISDYGKGGGSLYFPNEKTRKPSGSVNKKLTGLITGEFRIRCYNSVGSYDEAFVTVRIDRPEAVINSFTVNPVRPESDIYRFKWLSTNSKYCVISDRGNFFPNEKQRKPSGSVNKKLTGLRLGTFYLACYNETGIYDQASVTVRIDRPETQ